MFGPCRDRVFFSIGEKQRFLRGSELVKFSESAIFRGCKYERFLAGKPQKRRGFRPKLKKRGTGAIGGDSRNARHGAFRDLSCSKKRKLPNIQNSSES